MFALPLTRDAERDLIKIWNYTADQWGEKRADKYLRNIDACFTKISRGKAMVKTLAKNIQFIRCQHHVIFLYIGEKPTVIAILHEKMDLLTRLKSRLD